MDRRRGEKLGWTLGLLGGSLWMIPLSIVSFWSGSIVSGLTALGFFALAVAHCIYLAPWRHPRVKFWKLFLPCCAIVMVAAGVLLRLEGSPHDRFQLKRLGPTMLLSAIPFAILGRRCWEDGNVPVTISPAAPESS